MLCEKGSLLFQLHRTYSFSVISFIQLYHYITKNIFREQLEQSFMAVSGNTNITTALKN